MSTFEIDFFEFSFLVEACIPPKPIARAVFWLDVIDKHYHKMTSDESSRLYHWIKKNPLFERGLEENERGCVLFEARFNPNNQYIVTTNFSGEAETHRCFKLNDEYHISISTSIQDKYIIKVEHDNSNDSSK